MRFHRCRCNIALLLLSLIPVVVLRIELSTTRLSAVSGPPALDYQVASVGMVGLEPTIPCPRNTWACRYPTSRLFPVRTAGFERGALLVPDQARCQASPRSVADRAGRSQWAGRARILVSGSSGRRSTVSATSPNKKTRCRCDTGLSCKSRSIGGRVSQSPVAQGVRIRRLTGDILRAFLFANATRPQSHHFWHLLLKATAPPLGRLSVATVLDATARPQVRKNSRATLK